MPIQSHFFGNLLRHRVAGDYRNIVDQENEANRAQNALTDSKGLLSRDSIELTERRDGVTKIPTSPMFEYLTEEPLAFGMLSSVKAYPKKFTRPKLAELMDDAGIRVTRDSNDDTFAAGTFCGRLDRRLQVTASRDGRGGVAFHVFEFPDTPAEAKIYDSLTSARTVSIIHKLMKRYSANESELDWLNSSHMIQHQKIKFYKPEIINGAYSRC